LKTLKERFAIAFRRGQHAGPTVKHGRGQERAEGGLKVIRNEKIEVEFEKT
jgi:hypothetical protein